VPTYSFKEQVWDWAEYENLKKELKKAGDTHEKLVIEVHAQVNSIMIGMLVAASLEATQAGVSTDVLVFNKNSERSLSAMGFQNVIKARKPTDTERFRKCIKKSDDCRQPCHGCENAG